MKVTCIQMAPAIADVAANVAAMVAYISQHGDSDLIVFPELATCGYVFDSAAELQQCALRPDSAHIRTVLAALPDGATIAFGFAEAATGGVVYNSAMLADGDGVKAVYRKAHLWDTELNFFTPGDQVAPVVDTAAGKLGLMVCYDLEFPEYTRKVAMNGAEALVVPTNWPLLAPWPEGSRPSEVIMAQAAARANQMPVICCDRSGVERGQEWTSGTCVIDHNGWVIADPTDGVLTCEVDLAAGASKQLSERNHVFNDRRPELY